VQHLLANEFRVFGEVIRAANLPAANLPAD